MYLLSVISEGLRVKLAVVKKDKKEFEILFTESYCSKDIDPGYFEKVIGDLKQKYRGLCIATSIDTDHVLLRKLTLPVADKKAIFKTLPFQIEQHLPFPIEEGIVYPYIEKHKSSSDVLAFCIQNTSYEEHINSMKSIGVDPHFVSCNPVALYRFTNFLFKDVNTITMYMGESKTDIVSVFESKPIYALSIPYGKRHFLAALKKDRKDYTDVEVETLLYQLDLADMESSKDVNLKELVEIFSMQLDRALYFVMHKEGQRIHETLFYTGEKHILSQFHAGLERSQDFTFNKLEVAEEDTRASSYALSVGLCLDPLIADSMSVQFRAVKAAQKELTSALVKKYALCLASMILLCIAASFSSNLLLKQKEKALDRRLATFIERNLSEDPTFKSKGIDKLSFITKLKRVRKHFSKIKKPYGYYLLPTTVSELIDTISQAKAGEDIKLVKLDYDLQEFPSLDEPFKEYKTRVEIKVEAVEKEVAELFFNELSTKCGIESLGIKEDSGIYGATFFLESAPKM